MNRGVLQSSPVQQIMMAGNPNNWWNMRSPSSPSSNFLTHPPYAPPSWHENQDQLPAESWSHLLMSGVVTTEEEKAAGMCKNWEEQMVISHESPLVDVKQESCVYGNQEFHQGSAKPNHTWSHSSSNNSSSCVTTTFSSSMLDFSNNKTETRPSSECNSSSGGGGALKKARVQPSTTQPTFKVRKEKLGDRITALHQLVSPFGKTDTASVLLEAIGYIRFLQSQIEALSLPYLGSGSGNMRHQQSVRNNNINPFLVQGEKNSIFPEDPGQLLNENSLKRKAASEQDCEEEEKKDLRSRGLCLVPVSCTLQVGSDNGADYWAPAFGGAFQ
ncbi:Myc-type, basic helix-loop-helix [Sesbania bispinosa]|nr:Myc-type, basic helix-loop-helix [Sesbania bispinosa]